VWLANVIVGTTAVRFSEGRVDDGSIQEHPNVYIATQSDAAFPVARPASWRPPYPSAPRGVSMTTATMTSSSPKIAKRSP
jgi:hypothetical protein